ncbi:Mce protein [Mycobacterium angelicum]|uniref:Mce protein n=1 Tax=Mycobacterium angelicum TaxID=470074 RepID=A0A1W9ZI65_MYCAN|nr:Mce protein [Mycobacterium angelicum]MCV7195690.1 Mce protein [Mycobacterium angelicum]ORA15645.1 Mce protein [Mycobacterium angelicum]
MEGDAGASRLNPIDADDSLSPEVTAEDSQESEDGTDQTGTEVTPEVTVEDSEESETGADQTGPDEAAVDETAPDDSTESEAAVDEAAVDEAAEPGVERRPSRMGRGWLAGISVVLLLLAGGIGAGGYFALKAHQDRQEIARYNEKALQAAKDCVAATQAPDTNSMQASEQKIIECGTDAYRTQALLYSSMLVQAYQASNVHVQVSDMRAAVERNNPDGSVDILVAMRVKVNSDQVQGQETGYRLRVRMVLTDGQYKISKLDQVTK